MVVISREAKDFSGGDQNDEILFFPLETKKTTFLLKIWKENVKFLQSPLLPLPFRRSLLCVQAHKQFGIPWGLRVFWEEDKSFKLCPRVLKYVQHIFLVGGPKNFPGRRFSYEPVCI